MEDQQEAPVPQQQEEQLLEVSPPPVAPQQAPPMQQAPPQQQGYPQPQGYAPPPMRQGPPQQQQLSLQHPQQGHPHHQQQQMQHRQQPRKGGQQPRKGGQRQQRRPKSKWPVLQAILQNETAVVIDQKVNKMEWFTGFECEGNKFNLTFDSGRTGGALEERSGAAQFFLKNGRPFKQHVRVQGVRGKFITSDRPFKFFFSEISVEHNGKELGCIKRDWSILGKKLNVYDDKGEKIYVLKGPIFHPWTFKICDMSGQEVGTIKKKLQNRKQLLKVLFTDADTFRVEFQKNMPVNHKGILIGGVFLLNILYFEKNRSNNNH